MTLHGRSEKCLTCKHGCVIWGERWHECFGAGWKFYAKAKTSVRQPPEPEAP